MSRKFMVVRHVFEGANLESVLWKDRPCWVARHIGKVLGYVRDGGRLAEMVRDDPEFVQGRDYELLTGDDLKAFAGEYSQTPESGVWGGRGGTGLIVLFESGVYMALQHTRKPMGAKLRRFIADDVMPQLMRTGRYEVPGVAAPSADIEQIESRLDQKMERFMERMVTTVGEMMTRAVTAIASTRSERMTVEMHDTRITVTNQSPVPEGWIRTWRGGAGLLGVPWTTFKREFEAMEAALVPRWALRYEEPVVTKDRHGNPIAIPRPAIAFHPQIGLEMARLKDGGGPLFS